jgi:hypothetical protein
MERFMMAMKSVPFSKVNNYRTACKILIVQHKLDLYETRERHNSKSKSNAIAAIVRASRCINDISTMRALKTW